LSFVVCRLSFVAQGGEAGCMFFLVEGAAQATRDGQPVRALLRAVSEV
jgi:hypothetical protein